MEILNEKMYNIGKLEIENIFEELKNKKNIKDNLTKLTESIRKTFYFHKFNLVVSTPSTKELMIMGIMFEPGSLEYLSSLVTEKYKTGKNRIPTKNELKSIEFSIIIDSNILFGAYKSFTFTAGELTAILLHEVGHILNIGEYIEIISREIDVYISKHNIVKIMSNIIFLDRIAQILIREYFKSTKGLMIRLYANQASADSWAVQYGYGSQLTSALKKIKSLSIESESKTIESDEVRIETIAELIRNEIKRSKNKDVREYLQTQLKTL